MSAVVDPSVDALVRAALAEDVGPGDLTTEWTVPTGARSTAQIVAKEELVVAGVACVEAVFAAVAPAVTLTRTADEGAAVAADSVVLVLEGPTRGILTAERTALNFLGRLSGIATLTRRFAEAVKGTGARIVDTRKTTPGWRHLEKAAVRAGGGKNHRVGLWDMVLVKDNHVDAAGGVAAAARAAVAARAARVAAGGSAVEIEVEVRSLAELEEVLTVGVDRVLLDNMGLATLSEAVARVRSRPEPHPVLEASGNVTLETVRGVARTGVDLISVGALTHSAPAADFSLRMVMRTG